MVVMPRDHLRNSAEKNSPTVEKGTLAGLKSNATDV